MRAEQANGAAADYVLESIQKLASLRTTFAQLLLSELVATQKPEVDQTLLRVEPLIGGIKLGPTNNQHFHLANGAVTSTGTNEDSHTFVNGDELAIELQIGVAVAVEDVISLRKPLVVMQACVFGDVCDVNCGREILYIRKRATRESARTRDSLQVGEVNNFVTATTGHPPLHLGGSCKVYALCRERDKPACKGND